MDSGFRRNDGTVYQFIHASVKVPESPLVVSLSKYERADGVTSARLYIPGVGRTAMRPYGRIAVPKQE